MTYRGNPNLNRSDEKFEWTEERIHEFVRCSSDPIYFIENYMQIVHVDRGLIKFDLYDYQREMIEMMNDHNQVAFCAARQSGKSSVVVAFLLWYVIFNEHKIVGILANKADTAREILGRLQLAYEHLPKWLKHGIVEWNKGSFELENGSKIIAGATSSSSVRGHSFSLIFIDEIAFVENFDEFYASVYPTISSGKNTKVITASCVIDSTYVFTNDGIKQISDFVDYSQPERPKHGYEVAEYFVEGKDGSKRGTVMVNAGHTKTRIISSKSSEIECSLPHKLWACKDGNYDWYESKDLEVGDYISIRYGMNVWGNDNKIDMPISENASDNKLRHFLDIPKLITPDMGYFLGLFLAEGYFREPYQVTITCGDDIQRLLEETTGLKWTSYDGLHYTTNSKMFVDFLKFLGFDPKLKAKDKSIPKRLLRCSREVLLAMISGMFDGDGTSSKRGKIAYSSTSKILIEQLRMLLLNVGITVQKYFNVVKPTKKVKVYSNVFILEINSFEDCELFYDEIGFRLERKQLRRSLLKQPSRNITKDVIPFARRFIEIYEPSSLVSSEHKSRKECLKLGLHDKFPKIISEDIKWEKIVSIEESENKVYDFSLDHNEDDFWCHSVIYNGIVGHQTPKGLNHFYKLIQMAKQGENNFKIMEIPWHRVPGRDDSWKENTLKALNKDQAKFDQEFNILFLGSSGTLIAGWKLKELVGKLPIWEAIDVKQYVPPLPDHSYVAVVDVSRGKGLDYSAVQVIDVTEMPYKQVLTYRSNNVVPSDFAEIINRIGRTYNGAFLLVEINDIGQQVAEMLWGDFEYENMLNTENKGRLGKRIMTAFGVGPQTDRGIRTTVPVKNIGCSMLKLLIEQDQLIINDYDTIEELSRFSKKGKSYEAEPGFHDDLVMGLVLFAWMSDQPFFKELTDNNTLLKIKEMREAQLQEISGPLTFVSDGREGMRPEKRGSDIWVPINNVYPYR